MLLSESQLRRTIRKILLENADHFNKLSQLLSSDDYETITQAVELGETLGYLEVVRIDVMPSLNEYVKIWKLKLNPELYSTVKQIKHSLGYRFRLVPDEDDILTILAEVP